MAALDRMVAENIHERGKEVVKAPAVDIAIPWQVKAALKKPYGKEISFFLRFHFCFTYRVTILDASEKNFLGDSLGGELGGALAAAEASASASAAVSASPPSATTHDNPTVNFVLMTRKGNKPQFKNLAVPSDSELALNLRNREEVLAFVVSRGANTCMFCFLFMKFPGGKGRKRTREETDARF